MELSRNVTGDASREDRIGRLSEYREKGDHERWHAFPITFGEDDSEYFQDPGKLYKKLFRLFFQELPIHMQQVVQQKSPPPSISQIMEKRFQKPG